MADLETRVRALEDRAEIVETVIRYAISLDNNDWEGLKRCVTDPIFIDFSDWSGMEPATWAANDWANFARDVLSGFGRLQHISPNHVVTVDGDDATCISYMYAQHYLPEAEGGDTFVMRGYYTNVMKRTPDGWKISGLTQHLSWTEGNPNLFDLARDRFEEASIG